MKSYSSFARYVTTNYAFADKPEVGHLGGYVAVIRVKVTLHVIHLLSRFLTYFNMPTLCVVVGCGHNSIRDKGEYSFYRIPKILTHLGEQTQRLSTDRRKRWLLNIYRSQEDLTDKKAETTRVCSAHFVSGKCSIRVDNYWLCFSPLRQDKIFGAKTCKHILACVSSGKPAELYDTNNIDWAPTSCMGHSNIRNPGATASRGARAEKRAKKTKEVPKKRRKRKSTNSHVEVTNSIVPECSVSGPPLG